MRIAPPVPPSDDKQQKAEPDKASQTAYGATALIAASKEGQLDVVKFLIEGASAKMDIKDSGNKTAQALAIQQAQETAKKMEEKPDDLEFEKLEQDKLRYKNLTKTAIYLREKGSRVQMTDENIKRATKDWLGEIRRGATSLQDTPPL